MVVYQLPVLFILVLNLHPSAADGKDRMLPEKRGDGFRRRGYSSHFYAEYPRYLEG
jgi:hypothetical protein